MPIGENTAWMSCGKDGRLHFSGVTDKGIELVITDFAGEEISRVDGSDMPRGNLIAPPIISEKHCFGEKKSFLTIFIFLLSKLRIVPYMKFLKFSKLEVLLTEGKFQIIENEDLEQKQMSYFIVAKKL